MKHELEGKEKRIQKGKLKNEMKPKVVAKNLIMPIKVNFTLIQILLIIL